MHSEKNGRQISNCCHLQSEWTLVSWYKCIRLCSEQTTNYPSLKSPITVLIKYMVGVPAFGAVSVRDSNQVLICTNCDYNSTMNILLWSDFSVAQRYMETMHLNQAMKL